MPDLILAIIAVVIWMLIFIMLIRASVISALRRARHEARVEKLEPENAKWLYGEAQSVALHGRSKR